LHELLAKWHHGAPYQLNPTNPKGTHLSLPHIAADDICSLEASDRTNFWDLVLWHPTEERKVVIESYHERNRQQAADTASVIAETVLAWITDNANA